MLLGISLGATIALQAVEHDSSYSKAVVAISPDSQAALSDASAHDFLQLQSARAANRRLAETVTKLGNPPFIGTARFQRRARLLADLGAIEHGRRFSALMRETLVGMLMTYGVIGTAKALRNLTVVQRTLLPELASLDLLANTPRVRIPVHYVFGDKDALTPAALITQLPVGSRPGEHGHRDTGRRSPGATPIGRRRCDPSRHARHPPRGLRKD